VFEVPEFPESPVCGLVQEPLVWYKDRDPPENFDPYIEGKELEYLDIIVE
jgi:hypothetical protein